MIVFYFLICFDTWQNFSLNNILLNNLLSHNFSSDILFDVISLSNFLFDSSLSERLFIGCNFMENFFNETIFR